MLDKEKRTAHIRDIELKLVMIKNLSKVESVIKSHTVKTTDFMNPYERKNFISILQGIDEISYRVCEYGKNAEREQIQIYPYYVDEEDLGIPLKAMKIIVNSGDIITHRHYLGSLLGLGIKREKIGDIYVHTGYADIAADFAIADYILMNLQSVSREKAIVKEIPIHAIESSDSEFLEKIIYLSSKRADAVISEVFSLSRAKAQALISSECLRCDYELISSNSKEIKEDSLLSLKGYGRAYFDEVLMETKKGRLRAKVRLIK